MLIGLFASSVKVFFPDFGDPGEDDRSVMSWGSSLKDAVYMGSASLLAAAATDRRAVIFPFRPLATTGPGDEGESHSPPWPYMPWAKRSCQNFLMSMSALEDFCGVERRTSDKRLPSVRLSLSAFFKLKFSGWSDSVVEFGSWNEDPLDDLWEPLDEVGEPLLSRS